MAKFLKENFDMDSGSERWVTYAVNGKQEFIGRFKHFSPARSAKHFVKFLTENFTVEEYFAKRPTTAPASILREKGFISFVALKMLKETGYPQTQAGYEQSILDAMATAKK